jgi:hypothetical protein
MELREIGEAFLTNDSKKTDDSRSWRNTSTRQWSLALKGVYSVSLPGTPRLGANKQRKGTTTRCSSSVRTRESPEIAMV